MTVRITARNLGPIVHADIQLLPLTVFIGPNNTGKSFLSALIYSAHATNRRRGIVTAGGTIAAPGRYWLSSEDFLGPTKELIASRLRGYTPKSRVFMSSRPEERQLLRALCDRDLHDYGTTVITELERCLGGTISEFVRVSTSPQPLEIILRDSYFNWAVKVSAESGESPVVEILRPPSSQLLIRHANEAVNRVISGLNIPKRMSSALIDDLADYSARELLRSLPDVLFSAVPFGRHYLPAARSGIMQSHRALAAFLVRSAPLVGLQRMEVPQLSGILTDFIGQLLNLEPRRPRNVDLLGLAEIADTLENDVMHGTIAVRSAPNTYPEILYRVGKLEVPLFRSSSMISELAPVVLYLRNVLRPGHQLIIEEPEAHLHPQSQRAFARALTSLEQQNVATLLTTHSDYLLSELNNMIRLDAITSRHRERLDLDSKADGLGDDEVHATDTSGSMRLSDKVAAYLFTPYERQDGGTLVRRLSVSSSDGIPDDEFGRVAEAMYEDSVDLQCKLLDMGDE